jgi:hemerythrin-like domain-containing protein
MNPLLAHDHADLDGLLDELFATLDADEVSQCHAQLDYFWARLAMHIRAEHLHLFPVILSALGEKRSEGGGLPSLIEAQEMIALLRHDHDFFMRELARDINVLRELITTLPGDETVAARLQQVRQTLTALSRRLAEHNRTEEASIYRWAEIALSAAEQNRLSDNLRREIENMPQRFDS